MSKISLPPSKSISNRALVLAALSDKPVILNNVLESDDTKYLIGLLQNLGVKIERSATFERGESCYKITPPTQLKGNYSDNFIGNAGTAARFGMGLSLVTEGSFTLRGVERMHQRPFEDLIVAVQALGIEVKCLEHASALPVNLTHVSGVFLGHSVVISGKISSQFITSLLLVGARMPQGLEIIIEGEVPSQPYIDMTLAMLEIWGIAYTMQQTPPTPGSPSNRSIIKIEKGIKAPCEYTIPPDMSAASIPIAFGKMIGQDFQLDYEKGKTLQGDEVFEAKVTNPPLTTINGDVVRILDFESCPDVSMTGMVLAVTWEGKTEFRGLESLRVKECDRIEAMKDGLILLGIKVEVEGDVMRIEGQPQWQITNDTLRIDSHGDHRIAFCFAILLYWLGVKDVRQIRKYILDSDCVSKTWPTFWLDLASWTDQLRPVSGVIVTLNPSLSTKESDEETLYLLVKKPRKDHAWQFPQGGVDEGENRFRAARRELSEECGEALSVKWVGERPVGNYRYFFPENFDRHDQNITGAEVSFYSAQYVEGKVLVDGKEIIDYKWATKSEIEELVSQDYWTAIKSIL